MELENDPKQPAKAAADDVAAQARRLEPWATGVFAGVIVLIIGDGVAEPFFSALTSNGYYPMATAARHIWLNLIGAASAVPLVWALWEARAYLGGLAAGRLWAQANGVFLRRIGAAAAAAALIAFFVQPLLLASAAGREFRFDASAINLALAGLGGLLIIIGRVLDRVVDAALDLKRRNDEIF